MRRVTLIFAVMFLGVSLAWAQTASVVKIIKPTKMDVSAPLREMVKKSQLRANLQGQEREIPNLLPSSSSKRSSKTGEDLNRPDPLLQQQPVNSANAPTVGLNFAGASNNDNQSVVGFKVAPPDPNMDVGPNHIVQTVNLVTMIWDKSGNVLEAPFATSDFWAGFGGDCEFNNDGDPIVLYDHLADRWVISQFVFSTDQCVCVSQGADPTGSYYRYQFNTPGNDYPKMGVMGDAYYMTIRNFSGAFNMDVAALDRARMLSGQSATIQIFDLSTLNPDVEGYIAADLDGPAPPSGTPGFIVGHNGGVSLVHNELEVYKLDVDFTTPGNSSLSLASTIPVTQFDLNIGTVPQPSPGGGLDALAQFTMHRATIRDFGSGQNFRMVLAHTVDANGANRAGVRWYEIRDNTRTGNNWTLFQEGTFSPDATHRWMPSIAMNANGDIGLSYTATSSSTFPSIRATGRAANDPLGTLQSEVTIVAGTGSQTGTSRWGDYSSLAVDPSNNTTFVGNHEYVITTGSFNWWTRIFSFDVTPPGPTPPTITSTPNTSAFVGVPYSYDADNTVDVTGTPPITFSFTGPVGFNVNATTGVVSWTPSAVGSFPVSITATNAQGFDTQNFTINVTTFAARINAGGSNYTDGGGDLFVADKAYSTGSFGFIGGATNTFTNAIGNTTDDVLYQSLRRTSTTSSFSYDFDVPAAGNYNVTLHLVAPAAGSGNFIMDVLAEGGVVFNDLNINAEAGGTFMALVKNFAVNVTDGRLDLDFVRVNKQALVCAIEVEEGTPPPPAPEIDVTPLSVNFGSVQVGQFADQNVTINNTGNATLTVTALNVTNGVFALVGPPSLPLNIPASGNQVLTVRFAPTAAGAQNGNLAIVNNDADESTVNVSLSGSGVTPSLYTARINSGGSNFTTGGGNLFVADQAYNPPSVSFGFVGGVAGNNTSAIANTTDDPLYQAFRRSATSAGASFQYNFDVPSGTYSVTLHLAAPNGGGTGNFVMTVQAEGVNVPALTNFDVNAQAGGTNTALVTSFSQVVTDGTLNLNFIRVNKTSIVSGIEVVQTAAPGFAKNDPNDGEALANMPQDFQLYQNHPNPFNPSTDIRFDLPRAMDVQLTIYNTLGETVRTLVRNYYEAGSYTVRWDGRLSSGVRAPSGIYIYRLEGNGLSLVRKMTLLQ
ncbi:choice-of-anchor D domain-containing protein [candidate division KSB1 bacterium]|nr:choice-of-anchor D domain-containing protein [candidate division KSB1 bacterium]